MCADLAESTSKLRVYQENDPYKALGMAVSHLMTKPAFAGLKFGHWSRILVGQINRKHYMFVLRDKKIVGFYGWAFTTPEKAHKWLYENYELSYQDSLEGESMLINAWQADDKQVVRFILDTIRVRFFDKEAVYYKRFYNNGKIRPMRLVINDIVSQHAERILSKR